MSLFVRPVLDAPARFVQEPLQCVILDCAVRMDVPFDHMPQGLDPRGGLVLPHARAVLSFVDCPVHKKLFAHIVPSPEVRNYFSAFLDRVSDHLRARHLCPVLHDKRAHIFRAPFVKAKHPHFGVLAALAVMCELGFVYLDSPALLSQFVPRKMALEVGVDQLPNPSIHIIYVVVL